MSIHKLDTQLFVGLKAFIKKGDKVLVLRDPAYAGHGMSGLDFPGGKYRAGGDIKEELNREVDEETGLKISIGKPFYTWTAQYKNHKKSHRHVFFVGFLCEYISGEVKLSEEHDKYEWVDEKSAQKWKRGETYWNALQEYFRLQKDD